ncbi:MAG: hypothetical protein Q7U57_13335 [Methylovulum sp.]|nr:hypothetical protein [Methylovulum sp.]
MENTSKPILKSSVNIEKLHGNINKSKLFKNTVVHEDAWQAPQLLPEQQKRMAG